MEFLCQASNRSISGSEVNVRIMADRHTVYRGIPINPVLAKAEAERLHRETDMSYREIAERVHSNLTTVWRHLSPDAVIRRKDGEDADNLWRLEPVDLECLPMLIDEIDSMDHFPAEDERAEIVKRYKAIEGSMPKPVNEADPRVPQHRHIVAVLSVTDYLIRALCMSQPYRLGHIRGKGDWSRSHPNLRDRGVHH